MIVSAPPRVLLVDDDLDFVDALATFLRAHGLTVLTASSGRGGVRLARLEHPDLVIMDVMMEERTAGFFAARELREAPELRLVPIVMLTSLYTDHQQPSVPADVRWLPHDALLAKPPDMPALLATIRTLLAEQAPVDRGSSEGVEE